MWPKNCKHTDLIQTDVLRQIPTQSQLLKRMKKYPKSSQQDTIPYLSLHLNNSSDSCLLIRHYVVQTEVTYHLSSAKRKELSTQHILSANVLQKPRWNKVLLTYRKTKEFFTSKMSSENWVKFLSYEESDKWIKPEDEDWVRSNRQA